MQLFGDNTNIEVLLALTLIALQVSSFSGYWHVECVLRGHERVAELSELDGESGLGRPLRLGGCCWHRCVCDWVHCNWDEDVFFFLPSFLSFF
jgi:hypothetical protein